MRSWKLWALISLFPLICIAAYIYCDSQNCLGRENEKHKTAPAHQEEDKPEVALSLFLIADKEQPNQVESDTRSSQPTHKCPTVCWVVTKTLDDPVALFTGVLCFVVFLQLIWMTRQENVLNKSVAVAEKSERAFVFIKQFDIESNHGGLRVMPQWENSGSTSTKNMLNHVSWRYFSGNIPDDFDFPDVLGEESTPVLIGPKAIIFMSPIEIDNALVRSVREGRGRIYIWGWADYDDVFKGTPRHRTEFCNEVVIRQITMPTETEPRIEQGIRFRLHKKHNGADEECMKKPKPYVRPA